MHEYQFQDQQLVSSPLLYLVFSSSVLDMIPVDPSSTLMYMKYKNDFLENSFSMKNFVFHTHQVLFDSMWLIKGKSAYHILESFRREPLLVSPAKNVFQPIVLECNGYSLESAKKKLRPLLLESSEFLCVVESANLVKACDEDGYCEGYDKRMKHMCKTAELRLEKNETLVLVAFNTVKLIPGLNHVQSREEWTRRANVYTKFYGAYQHSVARFDLYPDEVGPGKIVPPAYYYYSSVEPEAFPGPLPRMALNRVTSNCNASIRFH